jgi:hypothetical protein
VWDMDQHEPDVHQIERLQIRGRINGDVVPAHLVPAACLKPRRVYVRGQNMSGRTDGRRQRLGDAGPPAPTSQQRQPALTPSRAKCPRVTPSNSSASHTNRSPVVQHVRASGFGLPTERGVRRAGRGGHHHIVNLLRRPAPRGREMDISHGQTSCHGWLSPCRNDSSTTGEPCRLGQPRRSLRAGRASASLAGGAPRPICPDCCTSAIIWSCR